MKRLQNELTSLVNRGMDRHLRLAVTGLSRSGKTAFITAFVNQLLHVHSGARMPLFSPVREERLLGVKRIPQRDLGIQRFTYDEGLARWWPISRWCSCWMKRRPAVSKASIRRRRASCSISWSMSWAAASSSCVRSSAT